MSDNLENIINLYKKELEDNRSIKKKIEEKVKYFTHEIKHLFLLSLDLVIFYMKTIKMKK